MLVGKYQEKQLYFLLIKIIRNEKENNREKRNIYLKAGGKVEKKIKMRKNRRTYNNDMQRTNFEV